MKKILLITFLVLTVFSQIVRVVDAQQNAQASFIVLSGEGTKYIKPVNTLWGLLWPGIASTTTGCLGIASNGWISPSGLPCGSGGGGSAASTDKWATSTNDATAIEPNSALRTRLNLASSTALSALTALQVGKNSTTTILGDSATSTFSGGISSTNAGGVSSSNGLTITGGSLLISSTASSTAANGITLTGGCFSINGTCTVANTLGNWTGTFDGQEGSYYLNEGIGLYITASTTIGQNINLSRIGASTYKSVQDLMNLSWSPGITSGFAFSTSTNNVSTAAGTVAIRAVDSDVGTLSFADVAASSTITITSGQTLYIGVEYNAGSPRIYTASSRNSFDYDTKLLLGVCVHDGVVHCNYRPYGNADAMTNVIERLDSVSLVSVDTRPESAGVVFGSTGTRNVTVTAGQLLARLSEYPFTAFDSSASSRFSAYYRDGAGGFTKVLNQTQISQQYDNNSGTLQNATVAAYVPQWFYTCAATLTTEQVVMVFGRADYTAFASAQAATPPTTVPAVVSEMCVLRARAIVRQSDNTVYEFITYNTQPATGNAVTTHSDLANLSWTASGHTGTANTIPFFGASGVAALTSTSTITAANSSLTLTGSGAVVGGSITAQVNNAFSHVWTVLQTFGYASSTSFSALDALQVGRTATTTIRGDNATSTFTGGIANTIAGGISTTQGITVTGGSILNTSVSTSTWSGGLSTVGLASSQGLTLTAGVIKSTGTGTSTFAGGATFTSVTASAGFALTGGSYNSVSTATSSWLGGHTLTTLSASQGLTITGGNLLVADITSAIPMTDANGSFIEYAGTSCTNQFIRSLSALGAATCASINNGDWSGTDLSVANGGTGLSTFGGTNHVLYTTAADALSSEAAFTYAPSTDLLTVTNGTTTNLTVATFFKLPSASSGTLTVGGQMFVDTTTGQLRWHDGTNTHVALDEFQFSSVLASSTLAYLSRGGTTTLTIVNPRYAATTTAIYCKTDQGTYGIRLGTGSASTTYMTCTTSGTELTTYPNGSFTARQDVKLDVGTQTGAANSVTVTINQAKIAD